MRMTSLRRLVALLLATVLGGSLLVVVPGGPASGQGSTPLVSIPRIQGDGERSPLEGQEVKTIGVVTARSDDGDDIWIQSAFGDFDRSTSDGIKVTDGAVSGSNVRVRDLVLVQGVVDEQAFGNALPLTRIDEPTVVQRLFRFPFLPRAVRLVDLPDESVPDGVEFWERLEGMRVEVRNGRVVAPTTRFGEFALLTSRDAREGSGFVKELSQIFLRSVGPNAVDYNPERILVDDATLDEPVHTAPTDRVRRLRGVVDYSFGAYKVQPTTLRIDERHEDDDHPVSERSNDDGNLVVTTWNLENLFDDFADPDDGKNDEGSTLSPEALEIKLDKQSHAIEEELELPDILVVQEVENQSVLQLLADRVNARAGTNYQVFSLETSDGRGIEVGFMYNASDDLDLDIAFQLSGPDVEAAFGPSSASPGREPLVGFFDFMGNEIVVVGNHFKSKGGDDPIFGVNQPLVRPTETQRKLQAQVVRDYVDTILNDNPDANVIVTGDMNDFQFGEPGEGDDHPLAILEGVGGGVPLTNLIAFEDENDRFTFIFDGNSQVLDHTLVSPSLLDPLVGVDFLHFNASFAADLSTDVSTTLRSSDHDAVEARFEFDDQPESDEFAVEVLHHNDGESALRGDIEGDLGGPGRFSTKISELRATSTADGLVLVSAGDNFLASPDLAAGRENFEAGGAFYDAIVYDIIGYDAMIIGNHEFDFGPDVLAQFIQSFGRSGVNDQPPFLSANLDFSGEPSLQALVDTGEIAKSTVVERDGRRIGIVGATTEELRSVSSPRDVVINEVLPAVQAEIDALEADGVDIIILAAHLQGLAIDRALVPQLRGVDIAVAGGGDELLANPDNLLIPGDEGDVFGPYPLLVPRADGRPVPIVVGPGDYEYIGQLIGSFDDEGDLVGVNSGPVRVVSPAIGADGVDPDPAIITAVVDPVEQFVADLAATVIADSEVALDGIRNNVRSQETNQGNLIADALLQTGVDEAANFGVPVPDVAIVNGGGIRNDDLRGPGDITRLDTFDMLPFSNITSVVPDLTREQFKELMEHAVRDPLPDGGFAQVGGFSVVYDLAQPAQQVDAAGNVTSPGSRVRSLILDDGTVIVEDGLVQAGDAIGLVTTDFTARGGDGYPFRSAAFEPVGVSYQQSLENFIVNDLAGSITAADYPEGGEGRISFFP